MIFGKQKYGAEPGDSLEVRIMDLPIRSTYGINAVDFEVSQVVDRTLGVHAMIPKSICTKKKFPYWT